MARKSSTKIAFSKFRLGDLLSPSEGSLIVYRKVKFNIAMPGVVIVRHPVCDLIGKTRYISPSSRFVSVSALPKVKCVHRRS